MSNEEAQVWVAYRDPESGRIWWWNSESEEVHWASPSDADDAWWKGWVEYIDPMLGQPWWWNSRTNDARWGANASPRSDRGEQVESVVETSS